MFEAHGAHASLQVCQHRRVLPDFCGRDRREFHPAEDHIQEQVYEEWAQRPDWQPGPGGPFLHHQQHPHQHL